VCKPALPFEDRCAHVVRVRKEHNNIWHSNMQYAACKHASCSMQTCHHAPSTTQDLTCNMTRAVRGWLARQGQRRKPWRACACRRGSFRWVSAEHGCGCRLAKVSAAQVVRGPVSPSAHEGEAAGD
jgi:hypothetical protein